MIKPNQPIHNANGVYHHDVNYLIVDILNDNFSLYFAFEDLHLQEVFLKKSQKEQKIKKEFFYNR